MFKNVLLVVLLLVGVALGGLLVAEKRRTREQSGQVAHLTTEVSQQKQELQKAKVAMTEVEGKRQQVAEKLKVKTQSLREAREAVAQAEAAQAHPSPTPGTAVSGLASMFSPPKGTGGKGAASPFSASIAKMMKDPAMKNMMRTTQSGVFKQMYGDLVKKWSLSPEEADTFYNLLLDKQADQMDLGMKMLEKGPDSVGDFKPDDMDAKIKASLGDDLYQQYKDYEKTIGGRYTVNQFQQSLASNNVAALTPDQSTAMLRTVNEEKLDLPPEALGMSNGKFNGFNLNAEQLDKYMKAQEDLNTRIAARASQILNTDQMRILKEQQQQSLAMQKMGMEMASKMMGPAPTP